MTNPVTAQAIREAMKEKPSFYIYAMDSKLRESRIYAVKTKHGLVYGKALNTGKWFVIHSWDQR